MSNEELSRPTAAISVLCVLCVLFLPVAATALETDRLKVQRKDVFEFTEKPKVTRQGDKVTVMFASKDYCDATVAIEDAQGKIVRHLASGVLGKNAPAPFQKDSLKQTIIWDGKDEIGRYVDDKDSHTVRVSLGLEPRMERTLYWSGQKMAGMQPVIPKAAPEGMYVFFPGQCDQLRLLDHEGDYVRTIYPFPADKIAQVKGLKWLEFPPNNERLPSKLTGHDQDTFFAAGENRDFTDMAVQGTRICLAGRWLVRLATDGSTGGLPLNGPRLMIPRNSEVEKRPEGTWNWSGPRGDEHDAGDFFLPMSAALSPDGKWLYLTGYHRHTGYLWPDTFIHGVARVAVEGDAPPAPFLGSLEEKGFGSDNEHFKQPVGVECDAQGRIYVADQVNHRVQIFSADGKYLKGLAVRYPTTVRVDRATGDIYVFSWMVPSTLNMSAGGYLHPPPEAVRESRVTHFGPFENPKVMGSYPLQIDGIVGVLGGRAEVDGYGKGRQLWTTRGDWYDSRLDWRRRNATLYEEQGGKLVEVRDLDQEATRMLVRARPPHFGRPRLWVNPADGLLYLGLIVWDMPVACKSFSEVVRINPSTGAISVHQMPTNAEDMGFDWEGRAYLRGQDWIARFDPATWREIPFDYGEERIVCHDDGAAKPYAAHSAITLPSCIGGTFHMGGFGVSPEGNAVVSCINPNSPDEKKRMAEKNVHAGRAGGNAYTPPVYPGRNMGMETHLFDIHGTLLKADAVPGIGGSTMLQIDRDNNVYALASSAPYLGGRPYFNGRGETLIKLVPGKMKATTGTSWAILPLPEAQQPKRPYDMTRPGMWVHGAEWLFGPVGADGHNGSGGHCSCYVNGRFSLDYFGRSFAPEVDRFRVVVLDTNGNVILRIGTYGNVDDGMPLVKPDPAAAGKMGAQPFSPRSIGGDEVGIMHCMNLTVHSDRRLFLADIGNQCIRSVKLGYHAGEKVALKDVKDMGKTQ